MIQTQRGQKANKAQAEATAKPRGKAKEQAVAKAPAETQKDKKKRKEKEMQETPPLGRGSIMQLFGKRAAVQEKKSVEFDAD